MRSTLCAIFVISGVAALLFETLWFREAGLALGNSVWTSSLVTGSFMGGLALGSLLAARHADRLRRPIRTYALLEIAIGLSGMLLVWFLPRLPAVLAPVFIALGNAPLAANALRLAVSFSLLMVPATAMGLTLPVLARALSRSEAEFGSNLGLLYGFNTLGAVVGAVLGEGILIEALGVRLTGGVAALLDAAAALLAWVVSRRVPAHDAAGPEPAILITTSVREVRLLLAAFVSGGSLLALEVLWFRLLQQCSAATSWSFAVMLAVVLIGIAIGGLLGAPLSRRTERAAALLPCLAFIAGFGTVGAYAGLPRVLDALGGGFLFEPSRILAAAASLMLPTAVASGLIFTASGAVLRGCRGADAETVGVLTLANTCGALVGAVAAALVLLPALGSETSLFLAVILYGLVAALTVDGSRLQGRTLRLATIVAPLALYGLGVGFFPFGLMRNHFLRRSIEPFRGGGRVVALREGLTETLTYTRRELFGQAVDHRLIVNGFSMSGSFHAGARYMRLFVYLPVALHPRPHSALLISYGVGVTAQALTDTTSLDSIDVVDISGDVIDLARSVHPVPGPMPLDDPRVRIQLEDGRFFLLTTGRSYDLITGEPPPPRHNGIVNLYSKEYFGLMRQRLRPGGVASYWLPVAQLELTETRAILRAFCDVFEDCSLWNGSLYDWVLLGSNGATASESEESFARQWSDPNVRPRLDELGFERPELLGTTFLADADGLRAVIDGAAPLDDDHPHRIGMKFPAAVDPFYDRFMETGRTRGAFERSAFVRRLWPADLRDRSLKAFDEQGMINRALFASGGLKTVGLLEAQQVIASRLRTPVLWSLGSSARVEAIARQAAATGVRAPLLDELLGVSALADRRSGEALELLTRALAANPGDARLARLVELAHGVTVPH